MEICVVGSGYVGLVAGACFAETGHDVMCVDVDERKVQSLLAGDIPIYEPGLDHLVERNMREGRLSFTTSLEQGVTKSTVIFIAVGTPQDEDGSADLSHVLAVAKGIGQYMNGYKVVVDKSTVPVGTAKRVRHEIEAQTQHEFDVVSNPEFLKEGAAIDDFMKPDRVVIGVESEKAGSIMRELYAPFVRTNNPILEMDPPSAEMTKYAANTMLACRISMMNEIATLCDAVGADIEQVRKGIGSDSRIGPSFLFPGVGYGGSCFPKDVQAFIRTGHEHDVGMTLSTAVEGVNKRQKKILMSKIRDVFGQGELRNMTFAVWGLAFKPRTDDTREAPALTICSELLNDGVKLQVFDPEANETFRERFGEQAGLSYCETNFDALSGADALVICTEWNEFRRPNFERIKQMLKQPVIFDGRNLFRREEMERLGFHYYSIGRPAVNAL